MVVQEHLDDGPLTRKHLFISTTVLFGLFIDGYDLLVIAGTLLGIVVTFDLTAAQIGVVGAAAFVGMVVGAAPRLGGEACSLDDERSPRAEGVPDGMVALPSDHQAVAKRCHKASHRTKHTITGHNARRGRGPDPAGAGETCRTYDTRPRQRGRFSRCCRRKSRARDVPGAMTGKSAPRDTVDHGHWLFVARSTRGGVWSQ